MMNESFVPKVDAKIWEMFPNYILSSIVMLGGENKTTADASLVEFKNKPEQVTIDGHLQAWADAFKEFGEKHKKTPSSAYALIKRFEKTGEMPVINPIVDLYNLLSVEFGIPVGGEDIDRYTGSPELKLSDGTEPFETMRSGECVVENPRLGEIVWCDEVGVTCRRWNWRQGSRTRIDETSQNFWFVLEALPPFDPDMLRNATAAFVESARIIAPGAEFSAKLISKDGEEEIVGVI